MARSDILPHADRAEAAIFEERLARHQGIVFKVAATYAWDPEERRDLTQEILVQLWRAWPTYDPERPFSTWMYRIALNVAISHRRRARTRDRYVAADVDLATIPDPSGLTPDDRQRDLWRVITRLDDLHRALVVLYLDGHSYRDIAEVLGITETNVATKLHRLKERLREEFAPAAGPGRHDHGTR